MTKKTKAQLLEELVDLRRDLEYTRSRFEQARKTERWYSNLRNKEVIVMETDGALYLRGEDLDEYCKSITPEAISRAEILKELLPGLNQLFGSEYEKYEKAHAKELYDDQT